jgi:hypothetical protein
LATVLATFQKFWRFLPNHLVTLFSSLEQFDTGKIVKPRHYYLLLTRFSILACFVQGFSLDN